MGHEQWRDTIIGDVDAGIWCSPTGSIWYELIDKNTKRYKNVVDSSDYGNLHFLGVFGGRGSNDVWVLLFVVGGRRKGFLSMIVPMRRFENDENEIKSKNLILGQWLFVWKLCGATSSGMILSLGTCRRERGIVRKPASGLT